MRERGGDEPLDRLDGFLCRFIVKLRRACICLLHFWEASARFDLRFLTILSLRTLRYAFFVVRERPAEFGLNFFCIVECGKPGLRGRAYYTTIYYTMTLDSVLLI